MEYGVTFFCFDVIKLQGCYMSK